MPAAIDPSATITVTWLSDVNTTLLLTPSGPSWSGKVPDVGCWFVDASSGGGATHR